ncbi:phosphoribosylaminoimidazole-succinocarboxamide synthase [Candidatus Omnitrophus magneticus]|uniref:Phosphoribosylaminoimidazole-succinocarboxamide synthase n=1 Tax=Candidatus Omnitrophus magneticus TaxID=1609969 RepID=A0A0F0CQH4_9BACT|nr:phosphoribosylaminoimidazole-succinocarboxamide synthase [Candidatus Omnitrophus magneticus]
MSIKEPVLSLNLGGIPLLCQGKVRNVYDLKNRLLLVASDRISAFDVIMKNGIPDKGKVLTKISEFWFNYTDDIVKNHIISCDIDVIVKEESSLAPYKEILRDRSMLVKKLKPLPIECIVRGYISGSGWKDYKNTGMISGIKLPLGLRESDKLEEPIFTPSTKAQSGHDENISQDSARKIVGDKVFEFIKEKSIAVYKKARDYGEKKGIIIADTKFEFGMEKNEIIIMDEALTPDSSRFWPRDEYNPGGAQKSFDKQFVRDYLEKINWDKTPPGPSLPIEIVQKTAEKYRDAYKILTGKEL